MITTTLLDTWIYQGLSADVIGERLSSLVNNRQWARYFCVGPDGRIQQYCADTPDRYCDNPAGRCFCQATALNIAQVCCRTLSPYLPYWLLSGDIGTDFKMQLDNDVGYATIDNNPRRTDIAVLQFRKGATESGFYLKSIFPLFLNHRLM